MTNLTTTELTPIPLSDVQYRAQAEQLFRHIEQQIDQWLDSGVVDIDLARVGGMIEMTFPNRSKIIVNTQPPLHEIWLAAQEGGFHYKYVQAITSAHEAERPIEANIASGQWIEAKAGQTFMATLSRCASAQSQLTLQF